MSTQVRLCALYVAWLLATTTAAVESARAHAVSVDRGSAVCIREQMPSHLRPRLDEPPVSIISPRHGPHDPDAHDDGAPPEPVPPVDRFTFAGPQELRYEPQGWLRGPQPIWPNWRSWTVGPELSLVRLTPASPTPRLRPSWWTCMG